MILAFFKRPLGWAVGAIIVLLALWWVWSAIRANPEAEARLSRNQAEAALESGTDAVNTVGAAAARETAAADLTRENERMIRDAEGSDAPITAAARDAGLDALCKRAAYRDSLRCLERVR